LIAYVSREGGFNVYTVNVGNNQARQVTSGQATMKTHRSHRMVATSSSARRAPATALFLADLSGAHQVQLTTSGGDDTAILVPRLP